MGESLLVGRNFVSAFVSLKKTKKPF